MPARFARPTGLHLISEAVAFDLSDADAAEPAEASLARVELPRSSRPDPARRADRADEVLALCALWVFKDRRRRRTHDASGGVLPGL
jgi:hypothetical protein